MDRGYEQDLMLPDGFSFEYKDIAIHRENNELKKRLEEWTKKYRVELKTVDADWSRVMFGMRELKQAGEEEKIRLEQVNKAKNYRLEVRKTNRIIILGCLGVLFVISVVANLLV